MMTNNPMHFLFKELSFLEEDIKEYFKIWDGRPYDSLSICGQIMALADMIKKNLRDNKNSFKVKKILEKVENFIDIYGDKDIENSLEVCLFETIINALTHEEKDIKGPFKDFVQLLGPESLKLCKQNDNFWGTKSPYLWNKKNAGK